METTKIVRGNAFCIRLELKPIVADGSPVEDFDIAQSDAVLQMKSIAQTHWNEMSFAVIDATAVSVQLSAWLTLGTYGFQMNGQWNGKDWRWCNKNVFIIVEETKHIQI